MSKIQVEEKQIPFYYLVKSFDVMIVGLELNKYVNVLAKYYDVNDVYLFEKIYFIEGQEYLDWGSNDEYLIDLIASKLGLVQIRLELNEAEPEPIQLIFDEMPVL
jgi:hypothetical protein